MTYSYEAAISGRQQIVSRKAVAVLAGAVLLAPSAACSAEQPAPVPENGIQCQANPDAWASLRSSGFPLKYGELAEELGISEQQLRAGSMGSAVCAKEIAMGDLTDIQNVVRVSIPEMGSPCIAVGTQDDPRQVTATRNILALCADNSEV